MQFYTNLPKNYENEILENSITEDYEFLNNLELIFDINEFKIKNTKTKQYVFLAYEHLFSFLENFYEKNKKELKDLIKIRFKFNYEESTFLLIFYCKSFENFKINPNNLDENLEDLVDFMEKNNYDKVYNLKIKYYLRTNDIYNYFIENFDDYFNLSFFTTKVLTNYIYNQSDKYKMFEHYKFLEKVQNELCDDFDYHCFLKECIEDKYEFISFLDSIDGINHYIEIKDPDFENHFYCSSYPEYLFVFDFEKNNNIENEEEYGEKNNNENEDKDDEDNEDDEDDEDNEDNEDD